MRPALIAVRKRLLKFYSATCYDIGGDTTLDDVGTIINLGKNNSLPVYFLVPPSTSECI